MAMIEDERLDRLDASIEGVVTKGAAVASGDERVDAFARLAVGLRGLPDPDFKSTLRTELLPRRTAAMPWSFKALRPARGWRGRNRPFAFAGAGYGLLAGACCTTGTAANALGLASAATASAYIQTAMPIYVAVSAVGLAGWLAVRLLREQGLSAQAFGSTIVRHGLTMASAYGVMLGASMALAAAAGLY